SEGRNNADPKDQTAQLDCRRNHASSVSEIGRIFKKQSPGKDLSVRCQSQNPRHQASADFTKKMSQINCALAISPNSNICRLVGLTHMRKEVGTKGHLHALLQVSKQ
ncbi:MAG: hypothetical protein ACREDS_08395, partial [Limisphaerales bacterium]